MMFFNDLMPLMHVSSSVYVKQSVQHRFNVQISYLPIQAWLKGCGWKKSRPLAQLLVFGLEED